MPLNSEASFSVFENSKFTQLYFLENFRQSTKLQHTIYQCINKNKWKTYNSE